MKRKVIQKQNNSDMCVVCGMQNPLSLGAKFYHVEGGLMVGVITGRDEHQSYPNRMHGGMISAMLDEVIGRAINVIEPEAFGVTTELNVKYKKPVPLNKEIKVVGHITKNTRLVFQAEGFVEDKSGTILATATATYVKMTADKIAGAPLTEEQYFLVPDGVEEIEIVNAEYFNK
ncbi:MAG: PaaI family thioesterase [Clostridia bacterium]|nr:PaaI family thioesterase [Clostridia bacterium]